MAPHSLTVAVRIVFCGTLTQRYLTNPQALNDFYGQVSASGATEWYLTDNIAEGRRVRTFINGKRCVDLNDTALSRRGIFGLQIHAGGAMEVRFKDIKLEVLPARRNGR